MYHVTLSGLVCSADDKRVSYGVNLDQIQYTTWAVYDMYFPATTHLSLNSVFSATRVFFCNWYQISLQNSVSFPLHGLYCYLLYITAYQIYVNYSSDVAVYHCLISTMLM